MQTLTPYDNLEQRLIVYAFGKDKETNKEQFIEHLKYGIALDKKDTQHYFNPLHVYCRWKNIYPDKEHKLLEFLMTEYEPSIRSILYGN